MYNLNMHSLLSISVHSIAGYAFYHTFKGIEKKHFTENEVPDLYQSFSFSRLKDETKESLQNLNLLLHAKKDISQIYDVDFMQQVINNRRTIGFLMSKAPDIDWISHLIITAPLYSLDYDFNTLPFMNKETMLEAGIPKNYANLCDYFCHRVDALNYIESTIGPATAGFLLYYNAFKGKDTKRKIEYGIHGATYFATQWAISHLAFDYMFGSGTPFFFFKDNVNEFNLSNFVQDLSKDTIFESIVNSGITNNPTTNLQLYALGVIIGIALYTNKENIKTKIHDKITYDLRHPYE